MFKFDVTKSVWEKIKYWQIFEPVLAADEDLSIVFLNLLELLISKRNNTQENASHIIYLSIEQQQYCKIGAEQT
uniref:Uncharacterized protein n=1 Tax=Medicago truncatula TaxID=3880 RepID=A2Q4J3_MEDTR|nr:hypothetical protein MtrDRAFT_AC157502g3v2 [Medicago truncatula]